jgi:hypothetical protein
LGAIIHKKKTFHKNLFFGHSHKNSKKLIVIRQKMTRKQSVMEDKDDKTSEVPEIETESDETGSRGDSGNGSEDGEHNYFGKAESRKVYTLKLVVLLILLCVTIAVCFAVYHITSTGQQAEFEGR